MDTKVGAPDGHTTPFEASPVGLRIARLGRKGSQRFCWTAVEEPIPESSETGGLAWPLQNLAIRSKSQTDW